MTAKRGHKWRTPHAGRSNIRICEYCGVEKWNPKCYHFPHDHLFGDGNWYTRKPWTKEPPCIRRKK